MTTTMQCRCGTDIELPDEYAELLTQWGENARPICHPCNDHETAEVLAVVEAEIAEKTAARVASVPGVLANAGVPARLIGEVRGMERRDYQADARAVVAAWARGNYGETTRLYSDGVERPITRLNAAGDHEPVLVESTMTLFGDNRTGKSLLACFALGIVAVTGSPVAWVRSSRLASAAMSDDRRERNAADRLLAASYRKALVVDDIDKTGPRPTAAP